MNFSRSVKIILVTSIFLLFQNCSPVHELVQESNESSGLDSDPSVLIFENTLSPILQTNCAQCHSSIQVPQFAISDTLGSHDTLLNAGLVSLFTPGNSRIVQKVNEGHQGFPLSLAVSLENAILDWATQLENSSSSEAEASLPPEG